MFFYMSPCLHQVALLGLDILSAVVTRLQERFRSHVGTGKVQMFDFFVWYLYCGLLTNC